MAEKKNLDLSLDSILIAEFNYAMQTANQSNEDRVKIFQFLVANTLTIAATVLFSSFTQSIGGLSLGIVFMIFFAMGLLSLFQLSRLRLAWGDSVKAMNKIKDFYVNHNKKLDEAFLWKTSTMPKTTKKMSLAYQLALTIMFLNSITFGVGIFLLNSSVGIAVLLVFIMFFLQLVLWERLLKMK